MAINIRIIQFALTLIDTVGELSNGVLTIMSGSTHIGELP